MLFEKKYIFYLKDFCPLVKKTIGELEYIDYVLETFLQKQHPQVYLANPFNKVNIGNSEFDRKNQELDYGILYTDFNNNLKIEVNYDVNLLDDLLILKDYTLPLFNKLDEIFISNDETNVEVNWFYSLNIKEDITDDTIMSIEQANNYIYKNKNELFSKGIRVSNLENSTIPVKANLDKFFNLKKN
jgi:hypothetical protein